MAQPYRAAGLGEFWGRRYNLVVSNTLRFSVFEPLQQLLQCPKRECCTWSQQPRDCSSGCSRQRPGRCRACFTRCSVAHAVATTAAFAVSGLMHELCVW